jgi:hypothetical protein
VTAAHLLRHAGDPLRNDPFHGTIEAAMNADMALMEKLSVIFSRKIDNLYKSPKGNPKDLSALIPWERTMLAFHVDFNTLDEFPGGKDAVMIAHMDIDRAVRAKAGTKITVFCDDLAGEAVLQPSDWSPNGWVGVIEGELRDITLAEYECLNAISEASRLGNSD